MLLIKGYCKRFSRRIRLKSLENARAWRSMTCAKIML
uniref:Uncharacterized protein n=1 Tax=Siphoviridae sp. ctr0N4 TaxID=2826473 RepID=A0A8S5M0G6_9CAUD|nr:MAG TPA: hypothetical protein [Siphoviridae sp. ctr0N4]